MTTNDTREYDGEVPEELRALLEATRPVEEAMADLEAEPLELSWDPEFMAERLRGDIVEEVLRAMEEAGINKNQLAQRLGKSRQWVTRVLNEGDNFTVATIANLACALRRQPSINFDRTGKVVLFENQQPEAGGVVAEPDSEEHYSKRAGPSPNAAIPNPRR